MADTLDAIRKQVRDRMKELAPLVAEYQQLEEAVAALDGGGAPAPARATRSRASSSNDGSSGTRRGRRRGSGTRATEALKLVEEQPGITIPELAEAMGI